LKGKFISTQIKIISSWYDKQLHLVKWAPCSKALSPFLGAVYLSPLDYAMEKLCLKKKIYYIRYVDDLIILAKNRWDLRRSLKVLYSAL